MDNSSKQAAGIDAAYRTDTNDLCNGNFELQLLL